uniref:Uncharacterized protein n=1 Tax=Megaselia scalaris TaxID=36166 RepID=T1GVQ1_MEGSC
MQWEDFFKELLNDNESRTLPQRNQSQKLKAIQLLENNKSAEQFHIPHNKMEGPRDIRTVVDLAGSLIHSKFLSFKYWAETVSTVIYTLSRFGRSSVEDK